MVENIILLDLSHSFKHNLGIMLMDNKKTIFSDPKDEQRFYYTFYRNLAFTLKKEIGQVDHIYFCEDSFKCWRKTRYPEYKANRQHNQDFDLDKYLFITQQIKNEVKDHLVGQEELEADDIIYFMINKFALDHIKNNSVGKNIFIISGDSDLDQLVYQKDNFLVCRFNPLSQKRHFYIPDNFEIKESIQEAKEADSFDMFDGIFDIQIAISHIEHLHQKIYNNSIKINPKLELLVKVICGDKKSDNIPSAYQKNVANGKVQNIGDAGKAKITTKLNELLLTDPNILELNEENFKKLIPHILYVVKGQLDESTNLMNGLLRNKSLIELTGQNIPYEFKQEIKQIPFDLDGLLMKYDIDRNLETISSSHL
jgi:hypothetical protein